MASRDLSSFPAALDAAEIADRAVKSGSPALRVARAFHLAMAALLLSGYHLFGLGPWCLAGLVLCLGVLAYELFDRPGGRSLPAGYGVFQS